MSKKILAGMLCMVSTATLAADSVEEIVVTGARISLSATKTDTPLIEVPQSISVITSEALAIRNVQGIEEALRLTAGVTVDQYGFDPRYEQTTIRGFAATQFGDFRDGLKQASGNGSYFRTEPYGLDSLEVFKGPSSVLYGQNAPGGLVNAVSKRPRAERIRELQADVGTFDRYQGKFDFGDPLSDDVMYRVTGLYRDSGTQLAEARDDRTFIAPSLSWQLGEKTSLTILTHYLDDETSATPNYVTVDGRGSNVYLSDRNWDYFKQEQYALGYQFEHGFSDAITFRQNFRYGHIDLSEHYMWNAGFDPTAGIVSRGRGQLIEDQESYALDNQIVFAFQTGAVGHRVLVGVDYAESRYEWVAHLELGGNLLNVRNPVYGLTYSLPPLFATSNQKQEQTGVYVQDQIKVGGFIATVGGRYDDASTDTFSYYYPFDLTSTAAQSDDAFSYRAGVTYLFDNGFAPYASYSTSFQLTSGIDASLQPFDPTEGDQMEVGLKYQPKTLPGFITFSAFRLSQTNVLTQDRNVAGFFVQQGEVEAQGAEIELSLQPMAGLNLLGSYTWLDTENTSNDANNGKAQQALPEHAASLWADYTFANGWGIGGAVRYVGSSFADELNEIENGAETYLDAVVHYDLDQWRLAVNANNIADKDVFICSFGTCYKGLERTIIGSVRYRW